MTILTVFDDWNSPDRDGIRTAIIHDHHIVDGFKNGHPGYTEPIQVGKTVISFGDPHGSHGEGFSALGVIESVDVHPSKHRPEDGDLIWVEYRVDWSKS